MHNSEDNKRIRIDEKKLSIQLAGSDLEPHVQALYEAANTHAIKHGEIPHWTDAVAAMPELPFTHIDTEHERGVAMLSATDTIAIQNNTQVFPAEETNERALLEKCLRALMPWRKGPYQFGHIHIDTEWHSDWKWNRVLPHISSLKNKCVLDVGCGSGYHLWRMRGAGASTVLGIDPVPLFNLQFQAVQRYIKDDAVSILPITMDVMPENMQCFDTVFSMGILYHRRCPEQHLFELSQALKPGGELVIESLITPGEAEDELSLDGRYARMRNIWRLPSGPMLCRWIHDAGFENVRCVSVDITSVLEQRTTDWMQHESLTEALDPENRSLTVEGHPRPRRAVVIGQKPG